MVARRLERLITPDGKTFDHHPEDFGAYPEGSRVLSWPKINARITWGAEPTGGYVCILGGAPSLTETYTDEAGQHYDAVVAVNRSAYLFAHDWWFHLDALFPEFRPEHPESRIGWAGAVGRWAGHDAALLHARDYRMHDTRKAMQDQGTPDAVRNTSLPAAVWFALHVLQADQIALYGVDWDGNTYCDGETCKGGDQSARWALEEKTVTELCRDTPTYRCTPDGWRCLFHTPDKVTC